MSLAPRICAGCQPKRGTSNGNKHRQSPYHKCQGNGCICGSCHPFQPVTNEQYKTWMEKLGGFYVDNTKTLIKMVKEKKLKVEE